MKLSKIPKSTPLGVLTYTFTCVGGATGGGGGQSGGAGGVG